MSPAPPYRRGRPRPRPSPGPRGLALLLAIPLAACGGGDADRVPDEAPAAIEAGAGRPCPETLPTGWFHRRLVLAPEGGGTLVVEFSDRDLLGRNEEVADEIGGTFARHGVRLSAPLEGRPEAPLVLDVFWHPLWPVDLVSLAGAFYGENGENTVQGLRGWPEQGVVECELRLSLGEAPLAAVQGGFRIPAPRNVGGVAAADLPGDVLAIPRGSRRIALARLWWDDVEPVVALAPEGEGLRLDGEAVDPRGLPEPALLLFVGLQ